MASVLPPHDGSRRALSLLGTWLVNPALLLAAKAALAVGIAWAIAPHLPGVAND